MSQKHRYFFGFSVAFFMMTKLIAMKDIEKLEFIPHKIIQNGQRLQVSNFKPDGLFYCTEKDDNIVIINALTNQEYVSFKNPNPYDVSFCVSESGSLYACGGMLGDCYIVDIASEKFIATKYSMLFNGYLAFTPDQKYFVVAHAPSPQVSIKIFSTETGKKAAWMKCCPITTWSSISVTNEFVAAGLNNYVIWLLDIASNISLQLAGHKKAVHAVVFSPDGKFLLSGSDDTIIKLWDVKTKTCIKTFEGGAGPVHAVAWMPDGIHFASGTESNCIKIWNFDSEDPILTIWPTSLEEPEPQTRLIHKKLSSCSSYIVIDTDMFIQFESTGKFMVFRYAKTGSIRIWKLAEK